ncbi:MAG TPA: hypothetical protein VMN56_20310 [Casimicrobiaceae bacterium]|nr:hypothetical protein [Casimicrobiaceae bacterium]
MDLRLLAAIAALAAACQPAPPPAETAAKPAAPKPPQMPEKPAMTVQPALVVPPGVVLPSLDFPPGPLYYCEAKGSKTDIVYEDRVEKLCRRHPEMGPCQYERNACRAKGGRVFTQKGEEVTMAVEAEYDRVVMRVRFQADGGGAPAKKK